MSLLDALGGPRVAFLAVIALLLGLLAGYLAWKVSRLDAELKRYKRRPRNVPVTAYPPASAQSPSLALPIPAPFEGMIQDRVLRQREGRTAETPGVSSDLDGGFEPERLPHAHLGEGQAAPGPLDEATPQQPVEVESAPQTNALDLYVAWCRGGSRPRTAADMEFAYVRYGRAEPPASIGGKATHVLTDAPQAAEFVRFSEPGSAEAMLLPTPTAHYTPVMAHVFPGLTRDVFTPQYLETLEPSLVRRRDGAEWEVVHD